MDNLSVYILVGLIPYKNNAGVSFVVLFFASPLNVVFLFNASPGLLVSFTVCILLPFPCIYILKYNELLVIIPNGDGQSVALYADSFVAQ